MDISEPLRLRPSQESTTQIQEDVKVETDASIESNPTAAFFISLRSEDETVMDTEIAITGNERKPSNVDDSTITETIPAVTNTKVAIVSAEETFQIIYKEKHDMAATERETTTNEEQTREVKTNETRMEIEEVEETGTEIILACEKEIVVNDTVTTEEITSTVSEEVVSVEHETTKETIVVEDDKETVKVVPITKEAGVVVAPAVSKKSSWFRRANAAVDYDNDEEDNEPFVLEKTRVLAGGKKSGSAGLSTSTLTAAISASSM
ncbi:hypothetical protein BGZ72_007274 [Mortierella alpina]|nr:hypothetical protein BGZ72_007274 [Mortierella alpina]